MMIDKFKLENYSKNLTSKKKHSIRFEFRDHLYFFTRMQDIVDFGIKLNSILFLF